MLRVNSNETRYAFELPFGRKVRRGYRRRTTTPIQSPVWTRSRILESGNDPHLGKPGPGAEEPPGIRGPEVPLGYKKLQIVTRLLQQAALYDVKL
jgi:hypothetical protein